MDRKKFANLFGIFGNLIIYFVLYYYLFELSLSSLVCMVYLIPNILNIICVIIAFSKEKRGMTNVFLSFFTMLCYTIFATFAEKKNGFDSYIVSLSKVTEDYVVTVNGNLNAANQIVIVFLISFSLTYIFKLLALKCFNKFKNNQEILENSN